MPQLLREIVVNTLRAQPDFHLVELSSQDDAAEALVSSGADVLIVGCDKAVLRGEHEDLLLSQPRLRILAVDDGGREAAIYALRPFRLGVSEVTTDDLVNAIRTACRCPDLIAHGPVASNHEI